MPVPATIRPGYSFAFASAWLVTACPEFPGSISCGAADDECLSTSPPFTTGEPAALTVPTTTIDGEFQTVTGDEPSTSTGDPTPGTDSTTDAAPLGPPKIVEVFLNPNPITANGVIDVLVLADDADGVRMELDDGEKIELQPAGPGKFDGEIEVLSGLLNGDYTARMTPRREAMLGEPAVVGEEVPEPYAIELPTPGTELLWHASDDLGPGQVVALGVLPDRQIVEFGTHFPNGSPRCYLRRRDKNGVPGDVAFVLKDTECTAVDMKIDDKGAMFVLADRHGVGGVRWWHGQIAEWGKGAVPVGLGAEGETAEALALSSEGTVAVCGYATTIATDFDAMVQLFRPQMAVESLKFDYNPDEKSVHKFSERTQDCVFVDNMLVLAGEAYGLHGVEMVDRDRLFVLRLDSAGQSLAWIVAPQESRPQSGAQAIVVDDEGRLVVAGYTCDDDKCVPEADLRIYDAKNTLKWQVPLGAFGKKDLATRDLAWSPAGYAVVATGGLPGSESAFTVRAFGESQVGHLWSFEHTDIMALDQALALAIGRYGEVYAGGAMNGYPAVAFIGG